MIIRDYAPPSLRRSSRSTSVRSLSFVAALVLLTALTQSFAQSQLDDVHVVPRVAATGEPAAAPVDPSSNNPPGRPLRAQVDLVLVPVTVTDSMNRLVLGFDRDNFQIYQDKKLQTIQTISSEDAPVSIGVIFDSSGSMKSKVDRARQALTEFFKSANPRDEFFVIAFSDTPETLVDFTTSTDEVENKLLFMMPKGSTALLDAIYMGVNNMRHARYTKKALVIISDGGDNHSRYSERDIRSMVKEADIMIYAIGLFDRNFQTQEEQLGPELLNDITGLTGGRAFTVDNPNDLADVATKIGAELRNQYVIGYRPQNPPHDGKWHAIKVKLLPPKGLPPLHTYAKQGYYAPSE